MQPNVHRSRNGAIDERPVYDAVERMIGRRPRVLVTQETAAPRFVWRADFDDSACVYVKAEFQAAGDEALILEGWAIEQVRTLGVPVPETLALDSSRSCFPGALLIQQAAPGVPLCPLWREPHGDETVLDDDDAARVWASAGALLRRVHQIAVEGYGRLDDPHYAATGKVRGMHTL